MTLILPDRRVPVTDIDISRLDTDVDAHALLHVLLFESPGQLEGIVDFQMSAIWTISQSSRLAVQSPTDALERLLAALRPQSPSE